MRTIEKGVVVNVVKERKGKRRKEGGKEEREGWRLRREGGEEEREEWGNGTKALKKCKEAKVK